MRWGVQGSPTLPIRLREQGFKRLYIGVSPSITFSKLQRTLGETLSPFFSRSFCASAEPPLLEILKSEHRRAFIQYTRHDSYIRDMTHTSETWLIHQRHDSYIRDMTHISETWLIKIKNRDMTHISETWLIYQNNDSYIRDMTHISETCLVCKRHDSCVRDMTCM